MKILIVGAGAMASLFGGRLASNNNDVTLYNRQNEHVKEINRNGLTIIEKNNDSTHVSLNITQEISVNDEYDVVVVLIKAHANQIVLEPIKAKISTKTLIITLQNGIGNLETINKIFPYNDTAAGGAGCGASIERNGVITHRGWGKSYIGYPNDLKKKVLIEQFVQLLNDCGIETELAEDAQSVIWNKLMINIAYNALTALTRLRNGDLINTKEGKELLSNIVREALQIANVSGIKLKDTNPISECLRMGREDIGGNKSSMLMDILNHRKTEVNVINGAISREGKKLGIPTPYNDMITNMVEIIEANYKNQVI